jgi:4-aminobutyrate aminotransferase-like enzyme
MNTFSYNPLACVATLANIDIIKKEKLVERSAKIGEYAFSRLKDTMEEHEVLGGVRGKGLMIGVEVVKDKSSKKPGVEEADRIVEEAFKRGLYTMQMDSFGTAVLRVAPPLIINQEQLDFYMEILKAAVSKVEATR